MPDLECRIAKIEALHDEYGKKLDQCIDCVEQIRDGQKDQQGFLRGIGVGITLFVSALGFVLNYFLNHK